MPAPSPTLNAITIVLKLPTVSTPTPVTTPGTRSATHEHAVLGQDVMEPRRHQGGRESTDAAGDDAGDEHPLVLSPAFQGEREQERERADRGACHGNGPRGDPDLGRSLELEDDAVDVRGELPDRDPQRDEGGDEVADRGQHEQHLDVRRDEYPDADQAPDPACHRSGAGEMGAVGHQASWIDDELGHDRGLGDRVELAAQEDPEHQRVEPDRLQRADERERQKGTNQERADDDRSVAEPDPLDHRPDPRRDHDERRGRQQQVQQDPVARRLERHAEEQRADQRQADETVGEVVEGVRQGHPAHRLVAEHPFHDPAASDVHAARLQTDVRSARDTPKVSHAAAETIGCRAERAAPRDASYRSAHRSRSAVAEMPSDLTRTRSNPPDRGVPRAVHCRGGNSTEPVRRREGVRYATRNTNGNCRSTNAVWSPR